ncbi:ABC transporter ATP-binding protein [Paenibacillus sp. P46E]|uniref:ABC transporter ATP-binding protein n=1 Tax=Paenibacillus sp. P46E TaxID=1349436 RepID=UPI00093CA6F1|nr:ABC transporter ATP-binding protein [Paenibacillus sp. P46E]OKP94851.1 multidrug ABC transporter ATP-binding protein [Paenibacillus sp. P46E]
MYKLIRLLRPYRFAALLAPLFMLLEVTMDLLQPRLMASIVNDGVTAGNLGHITHTGTLMLAAAAVGLIGGVYSTIFSTIASQNFGGDLRQELFEKVQSFSIRSLERFESGSIVTRLTGDIVQLQNMVMMSLRMFPRQIFQFAGSLIMALLISPRLTVILLVMIPVVLLLLVAFTRMSIPLYGNVQEKLDRVNLAMQENLSGIRVVKAFVRSDYEEQRFGSRNSHFLQASLKAARLMALNTPLMAMILNFSVVAALWYGGILSEKGLLSVGDLAAFLTYITKLLFATLGMGSQLMTISRAKASAARIYEVLDTPSDSSGDREITISHSQPQVIDTINGRLAFEHVSFSYDSNLHHAVLRDIDFIAEPGQTIGIIGVNGAGKSTMVSLIPGFYPVTEGRITIDHMDINKLDTEKLHQVVGMVLQQALLFSGSILDNIRYGKPRATMEEVIEAARLAEAHDFISRLPQGYDTVLGQRGVNLSGGQKQRISIARTLLLKPGIIILDDCTSAVDLQTDYRIRSSLKLVMKNSTCLIIAQRIASIQHADLILVLEDGRITARGNHDTLLASSRLYKDIAASQQGA